MPGVDFLDSILTSCLNLAFNLTVILGAVRPGPKPWKKPEETTDLPLTNSTFESDEQMTPLKPHFGGGVIDGGRLSGFGGDLNGPPQPPDNRMFKIGLGVFGAIALILGSMLSVFYIQKKKKDEQLKRRKHRQTKSPQYPPPTQPPHGGQYPHGVQMGFPDPQMTQFQQQMPFPAQFQPQYAYQPQFDQFQNYSPAEQDQVLSLLQLTDICSQRTSTFGVILNTHL